MVRLLLRKFIFNFTPFAVTVTLLCILIYMAGKQVYLSTANDPQIEVAEKLVGILEAGVMPEQLGGGEGVDMASSLAVHISIYNKSGNVVASTARLNGETPVPRSEELDAAKDGKANIFTWQPAKDVRCAAVLMNYKQGSVLVGRSMRIVDERIHHLLMTVLAGWLVIMVVVAGTMVVVIYFQFNVLRSPI